jgi:hypothetical protein
MAIRVLAGLVVSPRAMCPLLTVAQPEKVTETLASFCPR